MTVQTFESFLRSSPEEVFAWHARPGAFERLTPPWQSIEIVEPGPVEDGSRVRLRMRKGPLRLRWVAEHREVRPGMGFTDVQAAGPFARWIHRHEFLPASSGSLLRDRIDYALPGGAVGRVLGGAAVRRDLDTTFAYRHETTARDLDRHRVFAGRPPLHIAVSGTHGLVGGALVPFLTTGGHRVTRLVRNEPDRPDAAAWGPEAGLHSPVALGPLDAVVHLAGEAIAGGRWTSERKRKIHGSRVDGTRRLVRSLARLAPPPRVFVCASAVGYYGSRAGGPLDESDPPGDGFLASVCRDWEEAAGTAAEIGMRVVTLRFGIVLSPTGGALARMLPLFRVGAGGRVGSGRQPLSWISIDDAVGAIHRALLDERLSGPLNVVAPTPVTQGEFARTLGRVLRRPARLPLPARAARLLFGEMAEEMLLGGATVVPGRLADAGFDFHDPELEHALARLVGRRRWSAVATRARLAGAG